MAPCGTLSHLDRVPGGSSGGLRRRRCRRARRRCPRDGHGRLDPPAGLVLRHSRADAHLRTRIALWTRRLRLLARQDRPIRRKCRRCGGSSERYRRATTPTIPPPRPCPCRIMSRISRNPCKGLRIGVPEDYFGEGLDPEVKEKVEAGIALLEQLGCRRIPLQDAAHRLRDRRVLHHRHGRSQLESRPLRWRALRPARPGQHAHRRCTARRASAASAPR